ncbi:MAG: hypothetical protein QM791_13685 [Ferruginibacter sp.]
MLKKNCIILLGVFFVCATGLAQPASPLYVKDALKANRTKLYQSLVKNTITKNLSLPLSDSTEENWMDAFYAMQLVKYKSPWADNCVRSAFDSIEKRNSDFQFALMELAYANYPAILVKEAEHLWNIATDNKVFALCGEYLLTTKTSLETEITAKALIQLDEDSNNVVMDQLYHHGNDVKRRPMLPALTAILRQPFFKNATVVYSFQRRNRNYPGIAVIRDTAGNFINDSITGNIFSVPQLARSISNLPYYFTGGNTPQGIFRMKGFAVSKSNFIGPTPNIQLTMPYETSLVHFMNDSSITDSVWTEEWYKKLLPESWKSYRPFYETYYASKVGRTEIIAHGTTVNPDYYKGQTYYPLTPTFGCLCTKEIWSEETGKRTISDQQRLVDYLKKAGGANGYYIVIELDDKQAPVMIAEVQSLLNP